MRGVGGIPAAVGLCEQSQAKWIAQKEIARKYVL
jgi:hypothetical protein